MSRRLWLWLWEGRCDVPPVQSLALVVLASVAGVLVEQGARMSATALLAAAGVWILWIGSSLARDPWRLSLVAQKEACKALRDRGVRSPRAAAMHALAVWADDSDAGLCEALCLSIATDEQFAQLEQAVSKGGSTND